jgi:glycosyltransferase involved in cell wall biosynthesis
MVERKRITLIFQYNDNWIGGTYYILNIIRSLSFLNDEDKPFINLIYDKKGGCSNVIELNYPYIQYVGIKLSFNLFQKGINKITNILLDRPIMKISIDNEFSNLYPVSDQISVKKINKFYYWIPDFQEHYLPHFFSKKEIDIRIKNQRLIKESEGSIIFSSNNALEDYNKFYPDNKNKKEVLRFVSILTDEYKKIEVNDLLSKYNIPKTYFIIPNQFWVHKNQELVLKAAKILKNEGHNFTFVFTGKEYDHRSPEHVVKLKKFVSDNNLNDLVKFLGFIDRNDQLQLMKNSLAIIQPSLFEGWSTVVEDAKAMNQFILLSDIPLHREQINLNCTFFDPKSPQSLAQTIMGTFDNTKIVDFDYNKKVIEFAYKFISVF